MPQLASHSILTLLTMVTGLEPIYPVQTESVSSVFLMVVTRKLYCSGQWNRKHGISVS